ncbi:MAG: glycerate kinase [Rhizobiales bacterium]|nr:glycerate kinase [Hyphomicrobiales bacterium]
MAAALDSLGILRALFAAAVDAANPERAVAANLPPRPLGRAVVIGLGKGAIPMAAAVEAHWQGPLEGFVVAPHGLASPLKQIETIHANHPVPDAGSLAAADKALALAATLKKDDLLIALVSGGGSSLMSKPAPGIAMEEKLGLIRALLKCGANIAELNCVRKHVSGVKGGRLARAAGEARIHTLIVSDVPGDDPAIVASGPTVADPTRKADALEILRRYRLDIPAPVEGWLNSSDVDRGPLRHDNETRVIVSPHESFRAATAEAKKFGLNVLYLGDRIEGEARDVAKVHAALALQIKQYDEPVARPCVVLSGGETSVTVRGKGRGGRNVEFALALAMALAGEKNIHALAADTDGVDGMEQIAGALITPDTLNRARSIGLDPTSSLENNDAHVFFEKLGDQVITGPTQTNVNDFRAILIV